MEELANIIAEECWAIRLRRLNRQITAIYDAELRPLGIRASQLNVLIAIARLETTRPSQIIQFLYLEQSTLSRNLERMRRRGWLEPLEDARDARMQPFRLTEDGRHLIEQAFPFWQKAQQHVTAMLGPKLTEVLAVLPSPDTATER